MDDGAVSGGTGITEKYSDGERISAAFLFYMHGATPHVLRHSYLTYAVGATTDFKTIQGISGHADIFTLLNRYAHSQEDKVLELSEKMAQILK